MSSLSDTLSIKEEVRSDVSESIFYSTQEIFKDEKLKNLFYVHCRKELSTENFRFLESVTSYQNIENPTKLFIKADEIFKKFLGPNSLFELNVAKEIVSKVEEGLYVEMKPELHLFDEVVKNIEFLMRDTIMRFQFEGETRERKKSLPAILDTSYSQTNAEEFKRSSFSDIRTNNEVVSFEMSPKLSSSPLKKKTSFVSFLMKNQKKEKTQIQQLQRKKQEELPSYWEF
jgi:hypothetical protein